MKKIIVVSFILIAIGAIAQNFVDSVPKWYNNPPMSSKKYYGVGLGTSKSIEIAESKAILQANLCIAEQVVPPKVSESKTTSKSKGGVTNEKTLQQKITEAQLTGVVVVEKAVMQKGDDYNVYVLLEMKKKKK